MASFDYTSEHVVIAIRGGKGTNVKREGLGFVNPGSFCFKVRCTNRQGLDINLCYDTHDIDLFAIDPFVTNAEK